MKILKHKNIMGIIYGILLLMPFLSILARTCYVVVNKNAYQSYYGETINEVQYEQVEAYTLNKEYHFQMDGYSSTFSNSSSIYLTNVKNYSFPVISNSLQTALDNNEVYKLEFTNYNSAPLFKLYSESNQNQSLQNFDGVNPFQFDFTLLSYNTSTTILDTFVKSIEYNKYSFLDNVFEYSLSQFIADNNFGKVNLFNWFTDLFLDNNAHNNMYVHYINWYLNYSMLVSCMHLLFLVLMWFVNYSKRLLDRGMNYDW